MATLAKNLHYEVYVPLDLTAQQEQLDYSTHDSNIKFYLRVISFFPSFPITIILFYWTYKVHVYIFFWFFFFFAMGQKLNLLNWIKEILSKLNYRKASKEISSKRIGARNSRINGTTFFCLFIPFHFSGLPFFLI